MGSRQKENTGTCDVRSQYQFELGPLEDYLRSNIEGFSGPLTVKQFKGGQSNPTYLLETASEKYVMRRKPPGKLLKSAHAVDREYQVISALYAAGFPVPKAYILCEDEDVVGTVFFIMAYVEGRIFWELDLPTCDPDERRAIYDNVNQTIADLHNFKHAEIGLEEYGRPGNYFARQISRWSKQYKASEIEKIEVMDLLIEWLSANIPQDETAAVVHGDFRLDNMILHPTEPRVVAVLDWELSTIGHPLGDFTYHLMSWQMPEIGIGSAGLFGKDLKELGIPSEEEYVELYCERVGRQNGVPNRNFYSAYNFFRIAAIVQGIAGRVRDGTASSSQAAKSAQIVPPLATIGWEYARLAGA